MAAGKHFSLGFDQNGDLYGWGRRLNLGISEGGDYHHPTRLSQIKAKCVSLAAGDEHVLLLTERSNNETSTNSGEMTELVDDGLIIMEAATMGETIIEQALTKTVDKLDDDEEKSQNNEEAGYLAKSMSVAMNMLPTHVISAISATSSGISGTLSTAERLITSISQLVSKKRNQLSLIEDESIGLAGGPVALTELWGWGRNGANQLGTGDGFDHVEPVKMASLSTKGLIGIYATKTLSMALSSTWDVHYWGGDNIKGIVKMNGPIYDIVAPYALIETPDRLGRCVKIGSEEDEETSSTGQRVIHALLNEQYYCSETSLLYQSVFEMSRLSRHFSRSLSILRRAIVRPLLHDFQTQQVILIL